MDEYDDIYTNVARAFLAELLEEKAARRDIVERKEHDRIVKQLTTAVNKFKETVADFALQIDENEKALTRLEEENLKLRTELNEAIMNGRLAERIKRTSREHPFTEHMSDASLREWQKLMQEIPRGR
jgi:chromosome segregation ATPase